MLIRDDYPAVFSTNCAKFHSEPTQSQWKDQSQQNIWNQFFHHHQYTFWFCFVSAMKSIAPAVGRSSGSIENLSSRLFSGDWDQRAERMAPLYLILSIISATNWPEEKKNDSTLIHECHWWIHQCTMWLSTQLELSEICKSKGLVFAQFSPKSDNSTFDWWKTLKNLLKKYSNQIFTKNVIFIGKKSVAGVWQSGNLAHN